MKGNFISFKGKETASLVIPLCVFLIFGSITHLGCVKIDSVKCVSNDFNSRISSNWKSYNWFLVNGKPVDKFLPVNIENQGGIDETGFVWADDSMWGIDFPDSNSILPFLVYHSYPLDLRNAVISVYLRGVDIDLAGGNCFFWVFNSHYGTRYHYIGNPLKISEDDWGEKVTFMLKNEKTHWFCSWSSDPNNPASIDVILGNVDSYGFSFRGFTRPVTGRLEMDEFSISTTIPDSMLNKPAYYINKNGENSIILCIDYDYAGTFSEGLADVLIHLGGSNRAYGYIDKSGTIIIEPQFDRAGTFSEGLAGVKIGTKWGYIDKSGKIAIQPEFDYAGTFSEGLAGVKVGTKWGYMDKSGKIAIQPEFICAGRFSEGVACVSR